MGASTQPIGRTMTAGVCTAYVRSPCTLGASWRDGAASMRVCAGACYDIVRVSGAEALWPAGMGTYARVANLTQGNRLVYQQVGSAVMYLFYAPSLSGWLIGSNYTSEAASLYSAGTGAGCSDQATGWRIYNGTALVSTYNITVAPAAASQTVQPTAPVNVGDAPALSPCFSAWGQCTLGEASLVRALPSDPSVQPGCMRAPHPGHAEHTQQPALWTAASQSLWTSSHAQKYTRAASRRPSARCSEAMHLQPHSCRAQHGRVVHCMQCGMQHAVSRTQQTARRCSRHTLVRLCNHSATVRSNAQGHGAYTTAQVPHACAGRACVQVCTRMASTEAMSARRDRCRYLQRQRAVPRPPP